MLAKGSCCSVFICYVNGETESITFHVCVESIGNLLNKYISSQSEANSTKMESENPQQNFVPTLSDGSENDLTNADAELEARLSAIKDKIAILEQLQSQCAQLTNDTDAPEPIPGPSKPIDSPGPSNTESEPPILTAEEKAEIDARSVYVGNVDYGATADEVETHFSKCGAIFRVTIMCNKADGQPKGFAYIEFAEQEFARKALDLHGTYLRERQLRVCSKRTNRPGMCTTNRFPRGARGRRSFGSARGQHRGYRGAFRQPTSTRGAEYFSPY